MKSLKYICLAFVALFAVACSSDEEFEPGKPASNNEKVTFSADNASSYVVALTDTELPIVLVRESDASALEVPVTLTSGYENIFSGAKTVKFEAGQKEATYVVNISDKMNPFQTYSFQIAVDEAYTNPYVYDENSTSPRIVVNVLKEDYEVVANGIYCSNFWFEDSWEQDLEYSPMLGLYRLPDVYVAGTSWFFHFDGADEFYFTDSEGNQVATFFSGYVHSTYGKVSLTDVSDEKTPEGYDPNPEGYEGEFYFPFKFTVSAGSFGQGYEWYDITKWIKKPWLENK